MKIKTKHPIQPVIQDENGVHRFRENHIVVYLMEEYRKSGRNLNDLHKENDFSDEDWEQFSQLTGYSVSGLCDLSFVSDRVANKALKRSQALAKVIEKTSTPVVK